MLYLSSSNHQNEYNFYYHNSFGRNTLSLYDVCRFLSKQQWRHILKLLEQEGIHIERIEAYEYPEARDIKHLFIRFKKEKEDTPFYLLSPEIFSKLTNTIIQEYSSNIK